MRFLVLKWWSYLGALQQHDFLPGGSSFSTSPAPHHGLPLIHSWALSRHAATEVEAVAAQIGAQVLKLLARLHMLLFTGALFAAAARAYAHAVAVLKSLPRTARIFMWALRAGLAYKRLLAAHTDHEGDAYTEQLIALHTHLAMRLAAVCRANGGVYVKFGQFAVAFGAIPREYRVVLAQLEDKARPRPFHQIRKVLMAELGAKAAALRGRKGGATGTLFTEFDEQATAAASLAQVHRARLASGEEVAVKLQYPGLRGEVAADLGTMKALSGLSSACFNYSLEWLYTEMEAKLAVELDFRNEIHNANRLRDILAGSRAARAAASVPHMHEALSTESMIIMEWIQGTKITDVDVLQSQSINPRAVGLALVKLIAELTFIHGYVHGDPHPGNLMVRTKGDRSFFNWVFRGSRQRFEIVLLDHGTYLSITPELREEFCQLWCSFATRDKKVQAEVSTTLAGERAGKILPVLLTHQARNRKEEQALQRSVGINCFSDMTLILSTAPRDLVELLRINTVIRASTSLLGVTMVERKRIFAWFARRGLPPRGSRAPHVHPSSRSLLYRARLLLLLSGWTSWCWTKATLSRSWGLVLGLFGEVLFDD